MSTRKLDRALRATLAPLERRIGRGTAVTLYALADQGSSGLANIVAFAELGRTLSVAQFGIIGTMIGLHYFIAGFHRSAVVLPFTTDHRGRDDASAARAEDSSWWWLGLALTFLLAIVTALAGLIVLAIGQVHPGWRWMAEPLLLAALISPSMLLWEFARRWLYKVERADMVGLCSCLYFLLLAGGAWGGGHAWPSAFAAALAWVVASLGALLLALPLLGVVAPSWSLINRLVAKHRADAGWLAATNLPYSVYSSATIVVLIGTLVGPIAAAVFSAARTLVNPAISIVSAIDSVDKPRAARAYAALGMAGLTGVVRRSRLSIGLATALYLGLVALFAAPLIRFVFAGHYAGLEREVRLLALGFFLFGLNLPSETMLIVLRAGRTMLVVRTITALLTLAALVWAAPHGVPGMAIAFAVTQAINVLLLRSVERASARTMESRS